MGKKTWTERLSRGRIVKIDHKRNEPPKVPRRVEAPRSTGAGSWNWQAPAWVKGLTRISKKKKK